MKSNTWNGNCHRCASASNTHIMSMFDTSLICHQCYETEIRHPRYDEARKAELKAIQHGDRNFKGIGWVPAYPMTDIGNDPIDW